MATEFKLVASKTSAFGQAVAVSGDHAIIGSRQPSRTSLASPGQAHIFVKTGTGWSEQTKVLPVSLPDTSDDFGTSVAMDGDYAIVGAPWHQPNYEGRAYVYHRSGSIWSEESVLASSDLVPFGNFGSSVAISADWAIVGSDDGAYVFQRTGSTWTQQAKLAGWGSQVSLSGQTAVINGPQYTVIVFQRNGTTWQQQAVLAADDAIESNLFGGSVSMSGDHIIVGAVHAQKIGTDYSGAAYVFARSGSAWVQQAKLLAEANSQLGPDKFGTSVAIGGDYAVVGDPADDDSAPGAGAAYIYRRKGSAWPLVEKVTASDAAFLDGFGESVAIDGSVFGGQAIVGAEGKDSGAAYVMSDFPATFDGAIDPGKYRICAEILFGLIGGGSGVIWLPGTGPVPVDPEPFKAWSALSPAKRDVLVGLAISEMANLVYDGASREEVQTAGLRLLKRAADQIRVPQKTGSR
jgi:hypothetical protein